MNNIYIAHIELYNIRCFKEFSLSLEDEDSSVQWGNLAETRGRSQGDFSL